jgi:creatinine amidohydrolase
MLMSRMNWMQVETYLKQDDRLLLVTGAVEQHGYLSLATDTLIPYRIAIRAARSERVLLAPPITYGSCQSFASYPGTLSLRGETYLRVIRDVVEAAIASGFRQLVILNGHGGNNLMTPSLVEATVGQPDVLIHLVDWYKLPRTRTLLSALDPVVDHANWAENFSFTRVGPVPDGEKRFVEFPTWFIDPDELRRAWGDGVRGGRYQMPDSQMRQVMATAVNDLVDLLRSVRRPK